MVYWMGFGAFLNIDKETAARLGSSDVPLRRMAQPSENVGTRFYPASDDSSFTTGTVIMVDKGTSTVEAFPSILPAVVYQGLASSPSLSDHHSRRIDLFAEQAQVLCRRLGAHGNVIRYKHLKAAVLLYGS